MENLLKSITREPYGITLEEVISRANEGDEISVVFKAIQKQQEEKPIQYFRRQYAKRKRVHRKGKEMDDSSHCR